MKLKIIFILAWFFLTSTVLAFNASDVSKASKCQPIKICDAEIGACFTLPC